MSDSESSSGKDVASQDSRGKNLEPYIGGMPQDDFIGNRARADDGGMRIGGKIGSRSIFRDTSAYISRVNDVEWTMITPHVIPKDVDYNDDIGKGREGVLFEHNEYVVKCIRIPTARVDIKRELDFVRNVARHHPDKFMQLYGYRVVIDRAGVIPKPNINNLPTATARYIKRRDKSPYVLQRVYSRHNIFDSRIALEQHQILELISGIEIMNTAGYYHRDIHLGNIALSNPGSHIVIIDYDNIVSRKDKLTKVEQESVRDRGWYNDMGSLYSILVSDISFIDLLTEFDIVIFKDEILEKLVKTPEFHETRGLIMRQVQYPFIHDRDVAAIMFVLNPDLYQRVAGIVNKKVYKPVIYITPDVLIQCYFACITQNVDMVRFIISKYYTKPAIPRRIQ